MREKTGPVSKIGTALPAQAELRFEADDAAAAGLRKSAQLADASLVRGEPATVRTVYFDTPGSDLQAAGLTLMQVHQGGEILQKLIRIPLKYSSGLTRFDIETKLGDQADFPKKLGTSFSTDADIELEKHAENLRQYLQINRQRETWMLNRPDPGLVCHLDQAKVVATTAKGKTRSRNLQQVVLEYREGDRPAFFAFARELARSCGLRVTLQDPGRVGKLLIGGKTTQAERAGRYTLRPDAKAEDVFRLALNTARIQIAGNREAAAAGDAEGIKQMRVGLRRLRAIAQLFRRSLGADPLRKLVPVAKEYGKILGDARDLDVFATMTMPEIMAADTLEKSDLGVLSALLQGAEEKRGEAHRQVAVLTGSAAFTDFCVNLADYLDGSAWRADCSSDLGQPARIYGGRALDKRLRKVMALGADLAQAPAHARHPLRLELKKIRYALHAFRPLYAKEVRKPYLSALSRLQDEFGVLNDAVVARQMALLASAPGRYGRHDSLMRALGASLVIGWSARHLERQAEAVYDAWVEFAALDPFWRDEGAGSGSAA